MGDESRRRRGRDAGSPWRLADAAGVAERPERRCDTDGIFIDTAWATIDTRGWLDVAYGEDYLYENQPVYKAFEACPISCSYTGACKDLTFEEWHYEATNSAGEKEEFGCCHVAERPETRCGRTSDDGVVASDACPVACGFCEPCVDDGQWSRNRVVFERAVAATPTTWKFRGDGTPWLRHRRVVAARRRRDFPTIRVAHRGPRPLA